MKEYCFGVDVGGTTVKLGLFDRKGNVLDKWEIVTRTANGGEAILPDIAETIQKKMQERGLQKEDIIGIGYGVPGPINKEGVVPHTANLGWGYKEVSRELTELTGIMSRGANDANAAALGETWMGGAKGSRNVLMLTLGTGVGGGIIVDGQILTGAHGAAGEIGHSHADDHVTGHCGCGKTGCLEQLASATGLVKLAREALAKSAEPSVLQEETVTAKAVFDAYKQGDSLAIQIVDRFGKYLGRQIAIFTAVLDPEVVVIGGGVSKAGPALLDCIRKHYVKYSYKAATDTPFVLATLGNDAGIYGCARLVLDDEQN